MLAVFFSLDLPSARGREMDSRILMQKKKKKKHFPVCLEVYRWGAKHWYFGLRCYTEYAESINHTSRVAYVPS